ARTGGRSLRGQGRWRRSAGPVGGGVVRRPGERLPEGGGGSRGWERLGGGVGARPTIARTGPLDARIVVGGGRGVGGRVVPEGRHVVSWCVVAVEAGRRDPLRTTKRGPAGGFRPLASCDGVNVRRSA